MSTDIGVESDGEEGGRVKFATAGNDREGPMQQQTFYEIAQDIAILGGVCIGIFAVFSPSWVWLKKQLFGWGSGVLCAFGTILIVSSIFKTVSLALSPSGLDFKLGQQIAELQRQVAETKTAAIETNQKFADVSSILSKVSTDKAPDFGKLQEQLDQLSVKITQLSQTSDSTIDKMQKVWAAQPSRGKTEFTPTPYMTNGPLPQINDSGQCTMDHPC
jgi:hypothetical protein